MLPIVSSKELGKAHFQGTMMSWTMGSGGWESHITYFALRAGVGLVVGGWEAQALRAGWRR